MHVETVIFEAATVAALHQMNPWWQGQPGLPLPPAQRNLVGHIERRFVHNLAPVTVVRGSRQIGKSTACLQVIAGLLAKGVPPDHILRVQFDDIKAIQLGKDPLLQLANWFQMHILHTSFNEAAKAGQVCYLFWDEVQNLDNWSAQLKFLVDHHTVQSVVTGSSALRIELGRDSLAGRIQSVDVGTLSLTEIGRFRNLDTPTPYLPDNGLSVLKKRSFWEGLQQHGKTYDHFATVAFQAFSERGGYPIAHARADVPWEYVADQLNETVVKRVIQHDLRIGEKGRKRDPQLLEELFRLCCRYAGQTPSLRTLTQELQQTLGANIGTQRVRTYLRFLSNTLLIRLVEPLEIRLKKKKSDPKICLSDHSLRNSWLQEYIPLHIETDAYTQDLATMSGFLAESIVGALFSSISGLDIAHLPAMGKDPEVDFVLSIGDQRIPIEIKYRNAIHAEHYKGLLHFMDKPLNRAPFGILVSKYEALSPDPRLIVIPLSHLLLLR